MPSRKYFVAIIIPPPLFEKIEAVKMELYEEHGLKGALLSPSHITLHRPFEWKEEKENVLLEKLSHFVFDSDFEITLRDFSSFKPRVIFVDVIKNPILEQLYEKLRSFAKRELQLFNEAEDERGFYPHVTVAFRDLKKRDFTVVWEKFEGRELSGVFTCGGFSLLRLEEKWREIAFFPFKK